MKKLFAIISIILFSVFVLPTTTFAAWQYVSQFGEGGTDDGEFTAFYGIALDSIGNIYALDNTRVQVFNSAYEHQDTIGGAGSAEGQIMNGYAIVISPITGDIYITDHQNHRVQKLNPDGTFNLTFGWGVDDGSAEFQICTADCEAGISGSGNGQFTNPWGIALDSLDNVYVTDYQNHRVQKFDSDGMYLSQFGSQGSAEMEFNNPAGITIDSDDNIYVADYGGNNRIQKFNPDATFNSTFGWGGGRRFSRIPNLYFRL